jgi:hypothetical protein
VIIGVVVGLAGFWGFDRVRTRVDAQACEAAWTTIKSTLRRADVCKDVPNSLACYGNRSINVDYQPDAQIDPAAFAQPGDQQQLRLFSQIETGKLDTAAGEWGLVLFTEFARLTDQLTVKPITFVLYGETTFDNPTYGVGSPSELRAFALSNTLGQQRCQDLIPSHGTLIETQRGDQVAFTVNGAQVTLGSTILVRAYRDDRMIITVLDGQAEVTIGALPSIIVAQSQEVQVELRGLVAVGFLQPAPRPASFINTAYGGICEIASAFALNFQCAGTQIAAAPTVPPTLLPVIAPSLTPTDTLTPLPTFPPPTLAPPVIPSATLFIPTAEVPLVVPTTVIIPTVPPTRRPRPTRQPTDSPLQTLAEGPCEGSLPTQFALKEYAIPLKDVKLLPMFSEPRTDSKVIAQLEGARDAFLMLGVYCLYNTQLGDITWLWAEIGRGDSLQQGYVIETTTRAQRYYVERYQPAEQVIVTAPPIGKATVVVQGGSPCPRGLPTQFSIRRGITVGRVPFKPLSDVYLYPKPSLGTKPVALMSAGEGFGIGSEATCERDTKQGDITWLEVKTDASGFGYLIETTSEIGVYLVEALEVPK